MKLPNTKIVILLAVLVISLAGGSAAAGQIIYVDADAPGINNGSSWTDAYNYLQDALADANSGDEVRVADGIYKPDTNSANPSGTGDREATFQLINGVTLKGSYAGFGESDPNARDVKLYETILSGDLNGDDVEVIDPCDLLSEPSRAENSYHVVTGDRAGWPDAVVVVDGFTITGGNANEYFPSWDQRGGGMYFCSGKIINCTISSNSARWGGGMCYNSTGEIINCTINRNFASVRGGGMCHSWVQMTNCILSENSAVKGGGGINNTAGNLMLTNCLFTRNSAQQGGAIWYIDGNFGQQTLTNCTFSGNSAREGGVMFNYSSNPTLINCILWSNSDSEIVGSAVVTYSDVKGGWPGEGNIDADPCFVDLGYWDANGVWVDGDYHLLPDSPCIDAGDKSAVPPGVVTDLDGKRRVIGGRIDMGAYEYIRRVPAEVRIVPRTINLTSKGKWITCYIRLGEDYDVADIDPNSVLLQRQIEPESLLVDEQKQVAIARFSRSEVQGILNVGEVELTISGKLMDGTVFEMTDVIRVIDKDG